MADDWPEQATAPVELILGHPCTDYIRGRKSYIINWVLARRQHHVVQIFCTEWAFFGVLLMPRYFVYRQDICLDDIRVPLERIVGIVREALGDDFVYCTLQEENI
jgi:hypothetical protein